jgi:putative hemolysin
MLGAEQARAAGGFYSETEFDVRRVLDRVATTRACLVEVGRACVHPDYRRGGVVASLLAGLTHYLVERRCEYVIGCASVSAADDVQLAARVCARLTREYLAPAEWRVFPREPFFVIPVGEGMAPVPPLIKGYLRLGAYVCGDPAWDERFETADLLLLLPMNSMSARHRARLLRKGAAA